MTLLPSAPSWLGRQMDGKLWMILVSPDTAPVPQLWTWDGEQAVPIANVPEDIRSLHLLPDGSLLVAHRSGSGGFHLKRRVGTTWTEVAKAPRMIELAGRGGRAAAGTTSWSWSIDCSEETR